jgi:hypothetical protein
MYSTGLSAAAALGGRLIVPEPDAEQAKGSAN